MEWYLVKQVTTLHFPSPSGWRQLGPPKHWYPTATLHITTHNPEPWKPQISHRPCEVTVLMFGEGSQLLITDQFRTTEGKVKGRSVLTEICDQGIDFALPRKAVISFFETSLVLPPYFAAHHLSLRPSFQKLWLPWLLKTLTKQTVGWGTLLSPWQR